MADARRTWRATCEFCHIEFDAKTKWARACKSNDCQKAKRADYMARNRQRLREQNACYTITCQVCGNVYRSTKPRAKYCAGRCTAVAVSRTMGGSGIPRAEREERAKRLPLHNARQRLDKAARGVQGKGLWTQGPCNHCGTPFLCPPGGTVARYCSPACTKRAGKQRRKARERSAPGSPITPVGRWEVLRDDNFTCWICDYPLNMDAKPQEDDAPTIDHVVALASGGTHERSNLRAAHRYCNAVKCANEWT